MAYKIKTRRHKNQSSILKIQTSLARHYNKSNKVRESRTSNLFQNQNHVNFDLQSLPISSPIQCKSQLKAKKRIRKNKLRKLYYQFRNGKQGKSLESVRMILVKYAIKSYKINTHNAKLKYIHNTEIDRNAAANYTLKDDNSIDQTFIKFYPQLFKLPFNSFINTIHHEAYHVFLYNKGIYDVDRERRCHKPIHEFLAEAKEILGKSKENPEQFYPDANRALKYWILIYKNPPIPDFRDIDENKLMEFIKKQFDRVQKKVNKRYADFIDEYGRDNQLAKKLNQLANKYELHRQ